MILRCAVACMLLLAAGIFPYVHTTQAVPTNKPLETMPARLGPWRMTGTEVLSSGVLAQLRPTDYLSRSYVLKADGATAARERVNLYIGFHDGGPDAGPIHSPRHCLPGGGWEILDSHPVQVLVGGNTYTIVSAAYGKDRTATVFLYWFQAMGRVYTDEYTLKLAELRNSVLHSRKDAAFIRIAVPVRTTRQDAQELGLRFAKDVLPAIQGHLPS